MLTHRVGLLVVLILGLAYLSFHYLKVASENEKWVSHTYKVLLHTSRIKFKIDELELSFKSYLRTKDDNFKNRVLSVSKAANEELALVSYLTKDNLQIQPLINAMVNELQQRVQYYKVNMSASGPLISLSRFNSVTFPDIKAKYKVIEDSESLLLKTRQMQASKSSERSHLLIIITFCLIFFTLICLFNRSEKLNKGTNELKAELATSQSAYDGLSERTMEISFSRDVQDDEFIRISKTCKAVLGYSAIDFVNDKNFWYKIVHKEDRYILDLMKLKFKKGESFFNQYRVIHKDGNIRWVENWFKPYVNTAGVLVKIDGTTRDITEQKLNEHDREKLVFELIRLNTKLDHIRYVSQKALKPIAVLTGYSQIMSALDTQSKKELQIIDHIQQSVSQIDENIHDLSLVMNKKDEIIAASENINLDELLKNVKNSLDRPLKEKNIQIHGNFIDANILFSNRGIIYSIFYNLISRGIANRRDDAVTEIYVETNRKKDHLEIVFIDNGQLLNENSPFETSGLYEPFSDNLLGSNVGLFVIKNQIEALNGTFRINSDHNKGTEFSILFADS